MKVVLFPFNELGLVLLSLVDVFCVVPFFPVEAFQFAFLPCLQLIHFFLFEVDVFCAVLLSQSTAFFGSPIVLSG